MASALVILADGFEEIEAVTIIDVLRRAGIEVTVAGVESEMATGSHGISIGIDTTLDLLDTSAFESLVLPGGMPGAASLRDNPRVQELIKEFYSKGRLVAAICAAPIALERAGVLTGKAATSYPGFDLPSAQYSEARVVDAGQIITSRGPGTALGFALRLVERLVSSEAATQLGDRMLVAA